MQPIYLVNGVRSAFGRFGGALKEAVEVDLLAAVIEESIRRSGLATSDVQLHVMGNVVPTCGQSPYLSRHAALKAGLSMRTPAHAVNRLCGSGMESVSSAAAAIALGQVDCAVASGIELMSRIPYLSAGTRWGVRMGNDQLEDALDAALTDSLGEVTMGQTAENLARDFDISREAQDEWAFRSQSRSAAASEFLRGEILPLGIVLNGKEGELREDEGIRGPSVKDRLPMLSPAFDPKGSVTAGNSSGINDGASAVVLASEAFVKQRGLQPLARIRGWGVAGCRPDRMGLGPAFALPLALKMAGVEQSDIDLFEINEAFAAQVLAVLRETEIPEDRVNIHGGAVAIGHPLGASGNRLLLTLARQLHAEKKSLGAATLCIGGGQGIAMVLESAG